jgi:hypothetical protein
MATKQVPEKRLVTIYEVIVSYLDTPISLICANAHDCGDGFLRCDPCPSLTPEFIAEWEMNESSRRIKRETWINKTQIQVVEKLGEINE